MNKRGQFFLIAALVIVAVIIALFTTYNYLKSEPADSTSLYLAKEIDFEASQVLSAGVLTQPEKEQKIQDLITFYAKTNPDSDIAIFYIDSVGAAKVVLYEQATCESPSVNPSPVSASVVAPITGMAGGAACSDVGGTCRTQGCDKDDICTSGTCNYDETLTKDGECEADSVCCISNTPAEPSCTDTDISTPAWNQLLTAGQVNGILTDGSSFTYDDYCMNSDSVKEHRCSGDEPDSFSSSCQTVLNRELGGNWTCSSGQCVQEGSSPGTPGGTPDGETSETQTGVITDASSISNPCAAIDLNKDSITNLTDLSLLHSVKLCHLNEDATQENCYFADVNQDREVDQDDGTLAASLYRACLAEKKLAGETVIREEIRLSPQEVSTGGEIDSSGVDKYKIKKGEAVELKNPSLREEPDAVVKLNVSDVPRQIPSFSPPPGLPPQLEETPQVEIKISIGEEIAAARIDENSMKEIGNYHVGAGSSDDEGKVQIDVIPNEVFEATRDALFSPEDGVLCFDFEGQSLTSPEGGEPTPDTSSITGRKITEGTLQPVGLDNLIKLKIGSSLREFEVNENQDFFVVIKKERLGERVVAAARVIKDLLFS